MSTAEFNSIIDTIDDVEVIVGRHSTYIEMPNDGDIFDLHFNDRTERYVYAGGDQCVPLYQVTPFIPYVLSEGNEPLSWSELMYAVDEAVEEDGMEVWSEIVFGEGRPSIDLAEKLNALEHQLEATDDPKTRTQILNTMEFLES